MTSWVERHSSSDLAEVVGAAIAQGVLDDERACCFHDLGLLRRRFGDLSAAFPDSTLHAVAVKANPVIDILEVLVQLGAGLEAASIEEVAIALASGCPPERIVFDSPAKTVAELTEALDLGLLINANGFDELSRIDALTERGSSSSIGLRVNPMVGSGSIAITSVADGQSKFGVSIETERAAIFDAFERYDWLTGVHVHVGSQGCEMPQLLLAAQRIAELVQQIDERAGRPRVEFVDIGGGLPAIYRTGADAPDVSEYAAELRAAAPSLFDEGLTLVTEFGRALHAGCGFALSRVEYVESGHDAATAIIHLGADMFMRPVYRPDEWAHEYAATDPTGQLLSGDERRWTIAGPLCFAGDIVARDVSLPCLRPGDHLIVRDTGAYTMSMWSRHCSRGLPKVVGWDGPPYDFRVVKDAETPSDVVRFWSRRSD